MIKNLIRASGFFIRQNRVMFVCFCMAGLTCAIYIVTLGGEEWSLHERECISLLFQLSVGYIISFIFFLTQVYIPQYKQNREAGRCIVVRINGIVDRMREILSQLGNRYMGFYDESKTTYEYWYELLKKIDINDRIGVLNIRRTYSSNIDEDAYFTVKEWTVTRIELVERETDKLLSYYATYLNVDLMMTLEDILKSSMHQVMAKSLLQSPNGVSFESTCEDIFLYPYYKLMKKLESVVEKYDQ